MATWVQPSSVNHASKSSSPDVVVSKVLTSRVILSSKTKRTHATTVSLCTSRPLQRRRMTSINPSPLERTASVGTLLTNSPKRAPGALAPRGIIEGAQGPRIQLGNGLTRTKQKTDLYADDAETL